MGSLSMLLKDWLIVGSPALMSQGRAVPVGVRSKHLDRQILFVKK